MNRGCQSVYGKDNELLFEGEWDPKVLIDIILTESDPSFFSGKRVLDIGANTGGLSLEIARLGADTVASEPDPYNNNISLTHDILMNLAEEESLNLAIERKDFFSCHLLGKFDIILCLGLIYHFRYSQYMLDYLSFLNPDTLFISTQTHPASDIALYNRRDPSILKESFLKKEIVLTGWHPTRPLFERMLRWSGFDEVVSLTEAEFNFPKKQVGATNSAYYRAKCVESKDPEKEKVVYYPR